MSTKEAMGNMITSGSGSTRRIRGSAPKAGSVWDSRMKLDEVKGGIKVLIANLDDDNPQQETNTTKTTSTSPAINSPESQVDTKLTTPKQSPNTAKRKTWKSESSPVQIASQRSEPTKNLDSPVLVKKTRLRRPDDVQIRKVKSDPAEAVAAANVSCNKSKNLDVVDKNLEGSVEIKARSSGVCEDKSDVASDVGGQIKVPSDGGDDFVDDIEYKEIEVEKKSVDDVVKAITVQEKLVNPKKIVVEEKKLLHSNQRPVVSSSTVKKQAPPPPPAVNHAKLHPSPTRNSTNNFRGISRTNSKLQSFVDLVMWRDVSKSALIFGVGIFAIISSSYTKDLNNSFISVVSYLGLAYLAAIFLFRSLVTRSSSIDMDGTNQEYVVGEEEAIWLVKLLLPYVNEFLLKLKALFSGDPATTMKLAVLLFILARCGSSITIWKMAKVGFIGVFTVPKVCSSYSSQITAYGTFWIRRFKDGWESCSHKKAVGFAVFTLVWNLSSVVARFWAVFMLFVAFKYYQQHSLIREGWAQEEAPARTRGDHSCWELAAAKNITVGPRTLGRIPPTFTEMRKQKKVS